MRFIGHFKTRGLTDDAILGAYSAQMPFYVRYEVIPGAAVSEPLGSLYCYLARDETGKIERHKTSFQRSAMTDIHGIMAQTPQKPHLSQFAFFSKRRP